MLRDYVDHALRRARYEILAEGGVCATVPGLRGVVAEGETVEACREQLCEVIEEWILVRVAHGLRVPSIDGLRIRVRKAV